MTNKLCQPARRGAGDCRSHGTVTDAFRAGTHRTGCTALAESSSVQAGGARRHSYHPATIIQVPPSGSTTTPVTILQSMRRVTQTPAVASGERP